MSILLKRRTPTISLDTLPHFVRFKSGSCLRLIYSPQRVWYWRDGGAWGVDYEIRDGKLLSTSNMNHLNGCELIPVTEQEWKKCNGPYVPDYADGNDDDLTI